MTIAIQNLLYYPYTHLPRTNWAIRTLLYYDQIATIDPVDYSSNDDHNDPSMKQLVDRELVLPITPTEHLENPRKVSREFIEYIHCKEFDNASRRRNFNKINIARLNHNRGDAYAVRIDTQPFDYEIFYQLIQAGLAQRDHHPDRCLVEKKTANELILFMASILGRKINYLPATDSNIPARGFKDLKLKHQEADGRRELILENLIPFPDQTDLMLLKKFKEKNMSLLHGFRNEVAALAFDEKIAIGSQLFDEKIKTLELGKQELVAKMIENKLGKIFFGICCGISGAAVGLASARSKGAIIGGLPPFANAIQSALQVENIAGVGHTNMKYLALIDKKQRTSAV